MGGHGNGFQAWFFPVYLGFFALVALVAVAMLVAIFRRPLDRFSGTWPATRLRWSAVPVAVLALLGLQLVLIGLSLLPDKSAFLTARARIAPAAGAIGLTTFVLCVATLVEGIVYLLRVAFPSQRRRAGAEDGARAVAFGDGTGDADDVAEVRDGPAADPPG